MRMTIGELKQLINEETSPDLNTLVVGDVVDVDLDEVGTLSVRVVDIDGDAFTGEIEPGQGESGTMWFSADQVVPGSKAKGYFPALGEFEPHTNAFGGEDDWGRDVPNPYRKLASRRG